MTQGRAARTRVINNKRRESELYSRVILNLNAICGTWTAHGVVDLQGQQEEEKRTSSIFAYEKLNI